MICLDTNYLILGLVPGSPEGRRLRAWIVAGEPLIAPAVVWYEFLCGPVSARQVETIRAFLQAVVPFGEPHAHIAAELFNHAGRKRSTRVDAMIAAIAIAAGAPLATNNGVDFEDFTHAGLQLV